MAPSFHLIPHNSPAYREAVSLRESILRAPLGLRYSADELASEADYLAVAGYQGTRLIATAALVLQPDRCRMRHVAVATDLQNQGVGAKLLAYCEQTAREHGYKAIYCHARSTAIRFYLAHSYLIESEPFEEQGIAHQVMGKRIQSFISTP